MNHRTYLTWLALSLGSLLIATFSSALSPAPAMAQAPPGAVLSFSGPASGQARGAVVSGADGVLSLVSRRDVERAASSVGVSLDDHAGLVQVATSLGLRLVVRGRVTGRGRRAVVQVHVLDERGNDIAFREISADPRRRSGRSDITQGTREVLLQALTDLSARAAREQEAERQAAEAHADPVEGMETPEDEPVFSGARMPRFAVRGGWGGRNRNTAVRINPGTDKLYQASLFSELRLAFEARPFISDASAMRGLYTSVDMHFSLGLSSQDAVTGASIDSQAFGLLVQAGYLASVLDGERLMLGGVVGFGYESFSIDTNSTLPSSAYPHVRLGAIGRMQILDELLTVRADLGFRWAFGVGDFAGAFGKDSGALGYDVGLAVGGSLDMGFNWAVRFAYTRFGLDFAGSVDDAPPGCATDPQCLLPVEAAGGSDSGVELGLEAGWRFD
ncbi:MAG: hypothetical protein GXP55_11425 [Deltaproteobacteria bacterium]|nr:hypothetical protein [Deltaproteobacteria bacterium]